MTKDRGDVTDLPGVGPALALALKKKGATSIARLRALLAKGGVVGLPARARARLELGVLAEIPPATARALAKDFVKYVAFPGVDPPPRVAPVGSLRRGGGAAAKDLDFLVVWGGGGKGTPASADVLAAATFPPGAPLAFARGYGAGARRRSAAVAWRRPGRAALYVDVDLFLATRAEEPFALFHWTGPKAYNVRVRAHAKRRGWRLNQYGLFGAATGRRVRGSGAVASEEDLAALLGVTYRPPSSR